MVRRIARTSFSGASLAQACFLRHFDIDAEAVGISAGFRDQRVVGFGNGLQMDVAAEVMLARAVVRATLTTCSMV